MMYCSITLIRKKIVEIFRIINEGAPLSKFEIGPKYGLPPSMSYIANMIHIKQNKLKKVISFIVTYIQSKH